MSLIIGDTFSEVVFSGVAIGVLNGLSETVLGENEFRSASKKSEDGAYVMKVVKSDRRGLIVDIVDADDMNIVYSGVHTDLLDGDVFHFDERDGGLYSLVLRVV